MGRAKMTWRLQLRYQAGDSENAIKVLLCAAGGLTSDSKEPVAFAGFSGFSRKHGARSHFAAVWFVMAKGLDLFSVEGV